MSDEPGKDEKTEEATPRHVEQAREKGQVAQSQELVAALMLCAGGLSLTFGGEAMANAVANLLRGSIHQLAGAADFDFSAESFAKQLEGTLGVVVLPMLGFVLPALAVGILVGYGQIGFRVAPKAVAPELAKLDPVKGAKRMFSLRAMVRTGMAFSKIVLIAGTMVILAWIHVPDIIQLAGSPLGPLLVGMAHIAIRCATGALLVILALALFDFAYQRYQHGADLRMTKQQVKEEHKSTEGDPQIKARVRQMQREMARRRMMADVPKATVVVTNPTHFAIALRYAHGADGEPETSAPVVVAKGVDQVAQRIKAVAREAGVMLYEDVTLARTMYPEVEIGQVIPEDLYQAVAVVIRYVQSVRGMHAARKSGKPEKHGQPARPVSTARVGA